MSFVIVLYVREGIVMAADSRLTLDQTIPGSPSTIQLAVSQSDSSYKVFLAPTGVGILTFGAASINGEPLAGFIESFINEVAVPSKLDVEATAAGLLAHFSAMTPPPAVNFYVAGYTSSSPPDQQVWNVSVSANRVTRSNSAAVPGVSWGGEADILTRLIQPVAEVDAGGTVTRVLPQFGVPWNFFTLQDAIDFAIFAVGATIDAIRFQPRAKTVGGSVDVLVIAPTAAKWIRRKELHA